MSLKEGSFQGLKTPRHNKQLATEPAFLSYADQSMHTYRSRDHIPANHFIGFHQATVYWL